MTARWGSIALVVLVAGWMLYKLKRMDTGQKQRMGQAIACTDAKDGFPLKPQAEILGYGLEEPRGLAADANGRVFVLENNWSLIRYGPESTPMARLDQRTPCPKESCVGADQRGIAIAGDRLFIAEHGRGLVTIMPVPGASAASARSPLAETPKQMTGPSGIAAAGNAIFITDDRPWPGPPGKESSYDSADYGRWLDKGAARTLGAIYTCNSDKCAPELISGALRHPSGIAARCEEGPVFVAEADGREVRWPIYSKNAGKWEQTGALASVPISGASLASFLGVALDQSGRLVFAAGPGGLYVFKSDGELLGRMIFDEPVGGVAVQQGYVYLTVGHKLCRIPFRPLSALKTPPQQARAVLP